MEEPQAAPATNPELVTASTQHAAVSLEAIHEHLARLTSAPAAHDLLEVAMAEVLDAQLSDGLPVWTVAIGRPGSGKTTVARAIKGAYSVFLSDLASSASWASGMRLKGGKSARTLLIDLHRRCVVFKDLSAVLSEHPDKAAAILGKLCDIYDGEYSKGVGTRDENAPSATVGTESRFSLFACVTPAPWRRHQRLVSELGTRALQFILPALSDEERAEGFERARQEGRKAEEDHLRLEVQRHLAACIRERACVTIPAAIEERLERYATLVAVGRTPIRWERVVSDEGRSRYAWAPGESEDPFRVYQQLRSLLAHLARVNGRSEPTEHELRIVHYVALCSVPLDRAYVLLAMWRAPVVNGEHRGLTVKAASEALRVDNDQARQRLEEMERVGLLRPVPMATGEPGAPPKLYVPVGEFGHVLSEFSGKTVNLSKREERD